MRILGLIILSVSLAGCLQTRSSSGSGSSSFLAPQGGTIPESRVQEPSANRIGELEDFSRNLVGRVELLEDKLSREGSAQSAEVLALKAQLQEQSMKVSILQESLGKMEANLGALQSGLNQQRTGLSRSSDVRSALTLAEEAFSKKDWKASILNYQKYRDQNPKGSKVAEAVYKIGVSFQELGLKEEAKAFYDEVILKYPKEDAARRSRIRLKSLK